MHPRQRNADARLRTAMAEQAMLDTHALEQALDEDPSLGAAADRLFLSHRDTVISQIRSVTRPTRSRGWWMGGVAAVVAAAVLSIVIGINVGNAPDVLAKPSVGPSVIVQQGPVLWTGDYYPLWLPVGYTLTAVDDIENGIRAYLTNKGGQVITFIEEAGAITRNLELANAEIAYIEVEDSVALTLSRMDSWEATWQVSGKTLTLTCPAIPEDAVRIAQSVCPVR